MGADDAILAALLGAIPAIALPWLGGWLAVRSVPAVRVANPYLQVSLGFLAGQMLLLSGMALGDAVLGYWSVWTTLGVLLAAAVVGFAVAAKTEAPPKPIDQSVSSNQAWWRRTLTILFLSLCAIHLTFTAIEILHRPVYPWDAWLNWMYRAKAWYFADSWLAFDTPGMWLSGVRENAYAVAGRHYPPLVPVSAVWMALWTGGWTETLVNLPTLALGFALAFGVFGLAREAELPVWAAALTAYLLMSLPLLGAHLSLAGMADAWMAGYAGIGLACVFLGLYRDQLPWIAIGLGLLAASRLVKLEGSVWLLAGLLSVFLIRFPRITGGSAVALVSMVAVCMVAGITSFELPFVGTIGVVENRVYVPLIGNFALANWELLDDYRDNFLSGGSWHVLWVSICLGLILLLRQGEWRLAAMNGATLLALLLALVGIFQFTEQGAWAEDWSAINRLPLHFTPLLCLIVASIVGRFEANFRAADSSSDHRLGTVIFLIGATTASGLFYVLSERLGNDESGEPLRMDAVNLNAVIGSVDELQDHSLVYADFQDGIAVLSSGPISRRADDGSLLSVSSSGTNREAMTFFWRTAEKPAELQTLFVDQRGIATLNLSEESNWKEEIVEIGITAFDDGGSLRLEHMTVGANDGRAQRTKALNDWLSPNSWSQRSVNWIDAGSAETQLPLPAVLSLGATAATLILVLPLVFHVTRLPYVGALMLVFWLLLDARWLVSRQYMGDQTLEAYSLIQSRSLEIGSDRSVLDATQTVSQIIANDRAASEEAGWPPAIVALGSEVNAELFQRLRARYHLLPLAGLDLPSSDALDKSAAEHLLILKSAFREPGAVDRVAESWSGSRTDWTVREDNGNLALLSRSGR